MEAASELPLDVFADAAAALGHVHVAPDGDGVVRGLYLQEGPASAPWNHFSLALQCVAQNAAARCKKSPPTNSTPVTPPHWTERQPELIAYAGGPGHYPTYSYIDVLRGRYLPTHSRANLCWSGLWHPAWGYLCHPRQQWCAPDARVEVVAHILDSHLSGIPPQSRACSGQHCIQPAARGSRLAHSAVCRAADGLARQLWVGPWHFADVDGAHALDRVALCPCRSIAGSGAGLPPVELAQAQRCRPFLRTEMEHLRSEGLPVRNSPWARRGDFLERRINAVEAASRQLRDLHQFVSNSLQQLPAQLCL